MSLKLYYHPLSSFCHKVLIALYEAGIAFEPIFVDLGDEKSSASFRALWPIVKFPLLRDEARNCTVPESTVIITYLDTHYAGGTRLLPADMDQAWQVQMWDRFYDHYVHHPMQKVVGDNLRPADKRDPFGVAQENADRQGVRCGRSGDAVEDLGRRRRFQLGRLRRGSGAVLRKHGHALRQDAQKSRGL